MYFKLLPLFATAVFGIAQFNWDCTKSVGTCNNACYATYHNLAPSTLTYDSNKANAKTRRTASGCNRTPCTHTNYKMWGGSCDEYPFASTTEGGKNAILRCVEGTENSSEGGQLSKKLYNKIKDGDKFHLFIENYDSATFCTNHGAKNDGGEFKLVNGAFQSAKIRRDLNLDFVDVESRNTTGAKFREFETESGSRLLRLNMDSDDVVGTEVFTGNGTSVKIVKEIF